MPLHVMMKEDSCFFVMSLAQEQAQAWGQFLYFKKKNAVTMFIQNRNIEGHLCVNNT